MPETNLTAEELANILANGKDAKFKGWSSKKIGDGQGFLSHVVKVRKIETRGYA